jgi:isopenicillin N synthase-like dioxygenase
MHGKTTGNYMRDSMTSADEHDRSPEDGPRVIAFLLLVLAALALLSCESGSDLAPESSYRDDLRHYNEQILQLQRHVGSFKSLAETYNTLPEQARREVFKDPNESLRKAEDDYASLLEKRDKLKARVIKRFGRLPDWWTEPER